jgi:hypothetical protein
MLGHVLRLPMRFVRLASAAASVAVVLHPVAALAFSDVPQSSPVYAAAEYLRSKGIVQDADKFNPDQKLTRAQAAKILVAPLVAPEELAKIGSSAFADVPSGQWFTSYVEAARLMGLVDSAKTFNPNGAVTKAAFMKMLFASKKMNYTGSYSDLQKPLATDVALVSDWYFPVLRYALATSMTAVSQDGTLNPSKEITRGEMALFVYRLDMYLAGRRTQALLSQTETDISNVLQMLDAKSVDQAEYAAARAVIAARGALTAKPNEAIVKGALKTAEGFQFLVQSYRAGVEGRLDDAVARAKDAYNSAEKAKGFSSSLASIASQMQTIAKNMADEARTMQSQQ